MMTPKRLVMTCLATAALPAAASGQPMSPEDYILHGTVRDMRPLHPDFTNVSPDAYTRIAGLTAPELLGQQIVLAEGGGTELTSPARDAAGNIIPPHLAAPATGPGAGETGIASSSPTILQDGAGRDAYAISLESVVYNPDQTSSWTYRVEELAGGADLRRWRLELDPAHVIMEGTTPGYSTGGGSIAWMVPPAFSSGEFTIVLDQWYEADSWPENVSAQSGSGVVYLKDPPIFLNKAYADTYDSAAGPYDPETAGPAPEFVTGSAMPVLEEPALAATWQPSYILTKKKVTTLAHDIHTDVFQLRNGHTLKIDGDVTVLVEENFELNNSSTIELLPGATLKVYFKGAASILQASGLNNDSQDPHRVEFFNLGSEPLTVRNHNQVFATIVSPNAPLVIENNTDVYGSVIAQSIHMRNSSALHIDGLPTDAGEILAPTANVASPGGPTGCLDLDDTLAVMGMPHDGAITSSSHFGTWFNSVPGWSISATRSVLMKWNPESQSWRYRSEDFRPIDGDLYGAGTPTERNGSFTMAINAGFDFTECDERFLEIACDGDAWVYINGKLVMDIGGLLEGDRQLLELDRLEDLETGTDHWIMIFYANRSEEAAEFEIHTNLHLRTFASSTPMAPLAD